MSQTKKAFYPSEEVVNFLESVPKGQLSGRINELILKGLSLEHQEKIRLDYEAFNSLIESESPRKTKNGISVTMMMSAKAFEPEDEVEDFF